MTPISLRELDMKATDKPTVDMLRGVLDNWRYKPLESNKISNHELSDHLCTRMLETSDAMYVPSGVKRYVPLVAIEHLPWDTEIFGLHMARISFFVTGDRPTTDFLKKVKKIGGFLSEINQLCRSRSIQHLSCRVDSRDTLAIHALEESGFKHMDTVLVYQLELANHEPRDPVNGLKIRKARSDDLGITQALAEQAFSETFNRFYLDPMLIKNAGKMYGQWLINCFKGEQADLVLVAEAAGQAVGFMACALPDQDEKQLGLSIGHIRLNAVSLEHRRRGVYTNLLNSALEWFIKEAVDFVELPTQICSVAVDRAMRRAGGSVKFSYYTFHRWL